MKIVKMLKHYNNLFDGDVAGFDDETADKLIKQGFAELIPTPQTETKKK